MAMILAICAALSISTGFFLTRDLVRKAPAFEVIGPLFLLNAIFAALPLLFTRHWESPTSSEWLMLITIGILTSFGAFFVFFIVTKSSPAVSTMGQSLSPAAVLFIAIIFLNAGASFIDIALVATLVIAGSLAISGAIEGLKSFRVVILVIAQSCVAGSIAILTSRMIHRGLPTFEVVLIQQIVAGIFCTAIRPPKSLKLSLYPSLAKRSIFMAGGWVLTSASLQRGSVLSTQSILSMVPLITTFIQSIEGRKKLELRLFLASLAVIICVVFIEMRHLI